VGVLEPYDRLLIATGSDPIVLPLPGKELPGVVTFRDLDDVDRMLAASGKDRRAVVHRRRIARPGGGARLSLRGMHVTVVHLLDTLMERQLDAPAGALLRPRSRSGASNSACARRPRPSSAARR
jgi:nitrite reductase (NADH) large subunit